MTDGNQRSKALPARTLGVPASLPPDMICACRRQRYFFFGLALRLLAAFGLAAALVILPDPHPHRLHAILAPFKGRSVSLALSFPLLSAAGRETL